MSNISNIVLYTVVGCLGGLLGQKLKIPAGSLIGAMIAVIAVKVILKSEWVLPGSAVFLLQVAVGIMVGAQFQPSLLPAFYKVIIPVIVSCVVLVTSGIVIALIFAKLGILDLSTGYLGTSPGAMTILIVLALDNNVDATVITCFHLFRVIFVILTAPIVLKLIGN